MADFFLKDSKAMSSKTGPSNPVLALRKAALAAMPKGPLPCAKRKLRNVTSPT